jgi:DNA-binding NarL/FixJ family response regulator
MLVDDLKLIRDGIRSALSHQPDMTVVAEADNGEAALARLHTTEVDVVLMDIEMPRLNGIEATRQICAEDPEQPRVIVFTQHDLNEYVFEALKVGASGFLLKDAPTEELVAAIRTVHSGEAMMIDPRVLRRVLPVFIARLPSKNKPTPKMLEVLTSREREVFMHVAQGLSNAEIAERLFLSEKTAKTHVGRILMKLGLRDRMQIVILAYETGLIKPSENL